MYSLYIYMYSLYIYICTLYIHICIHVYEVPLICGHWQTSLFVTLILLACISQVSIFLGMFRCKPQIWPTCFQGIEISIIASKWQIHHCLSIEVLLPVADCMEWTSSSSTASWKLNWGYFVPKGIGILLLRTSSDFKKKNIGLWVFSGTWIQLHVSKSSLLSSFSLFRMEINFLEPQPRHIQVVPSQTPQKALFWKRKMDIPNVAYWRNIPKACNSKK